MKNELKSIFKYLLDFAKHPEQYNDDMVALLKVEQVIELLNYIDILNNQLQQKENKEKEIREYITSYINQFNGVYPPVDMRYLDLHKLLKILDKASDE